MKIRSVTIAGVIVLAIVVSVSIVYSGKPENENRVRVAFFPNISHTVPIVGIENGIIQSELGNQTEIQLSIFDNGPQVIEAMFADSIDMAYVGPGPAVNGFLKSTDDKIVILAGAASGGASFVVHQNSGIQEPEDLAGKRIAAPNIGNTQDVSLRHYLTTHGLRSAEKGGSVYVLNVASPEIFTLFAKGDIDAAWVPEPWATILKKDLGGTRLFNEEELWPEQKFASVLLIAKSSFIEKNPQLVDGWILAHKKTVEWIRDNPTETQKIFINFIKDEMGKTLPEYVVSEAFSNFEVTYDPITSSIYAFSERADSLGYMGRHGYNLDGIFYNKTHEMLVEVAKNG